MTTNFVYSVANDTLNGVLNEARLEREILDSSITIALDSIDSIADVFTVIFKANLSTAEETTLNGLIASHDGTPLARIESTVLYDINNNLISEANPLPTTAELDLQNLEVNVTTEPTDAPGIPVLTKKFRIEFDEANITVGSSYTTLYSHNGTGKFFGGILDFNSDSVRVKLIVDGETIFELTLDEIEAIQSFSSGGCNDSSSMSNMTFLSKTSGNRLNLDFDLRPLYYETSIEIQAQRTSWSNKRQDRQLIYISKEV